MAPRLADRKSAALDKSNERRATAAKKYASRNPQKAASGSETLVPYYLALALVLVFISVIRLRLRDLPLERDEGEYAYAGQLLLQGVPPYALAYNMKLPGTYVAYAGLMAILGQTTVGIHFGLLLVNAATIVLLFFLACRLFSPGAALVSAACYAILSTSPSVLGFAGHATHFVVLAAIAGILLLLKATDTPRPGHFLYAGALLGVSFLMKQPGIFLVLFGALWVALVAWRRKIGWRNFAANFALFSLGAVLPFALTCAWLWKAGVFPRFWFWTFAYARAYATIIGLRHAGAVFWTQFSDVSGPAFPMWLLAVCGLVALLWKRRTSDATLFCIAFLLFSFLAVCPGFYFRKHYFIVLLPAIALLAGSAVSIFGSELASSDRFKALRVAPALIFVASFIYTVWQQSDFFFEMDPVAACRAQYSVNPFPEAVAISDYLKAHTSPAATLAVLGSEPEIYFYAHRHSATGYIYTYPLMERQPYATKMQQEMAAQIEAARPEFIVFVDVPFSWLGGPGSPRFILDWGQEYVSANYQLDGIVDILYDSQYHWGPEAANYQPTSQYTVRVFKRLPAQDH